MYFKNLIISATLLLVLFHHAFTFLNIEPMIKSDAIPSLQSLNILQKMVLKLAQVKWDKQMRQNYFWMLLRNEILERFKEQQRNTVYWYSRQGR